MAGALDRLLDLPLPASPGDPADRLRRRIVAGGSLIGLIVAAVSVGPSLLFNAGIGTLPMAVFGAGCAIAIGATRAGLATLPLRVYALALVAGFFVIVSLQTVLLDWGQLKWLALVPMITHYLWDPLPGLRAAPRSLRPLWWGTAAAVALGALIVAANIAGWTAGVEQPVLSTADVAVVGLVDHALFVLSVAGLVALHQRSLRVAAADAHVLRSLLSMCSWCRRIQDADGGWISVEQYMDRKGEAQLTHGICPDCARRTFGEGA